MKRSILITGINGGLGEAFARRLSAIGDTVMGTMRRPQPSPFAVFPLDLTSDESIAALATSIGEPIDVLINNAGSSTIAPEFGRSEAPFDELSRTEFHSILDVNVVGTFLLTRALLPNLLRGRSRLIVNVSSDLASLALNTTGERYAYRCSKAALNMLTRNFSVDLAPQGLTCVSWHPGWVRTRMGGQEADISPEESAQALADFLDGVTPEHNGGFFDHHGRRLDW